MIRSLSTGFLILLCIFCLANNDVKFVNFTSNEGLSENFVNAVVKDHLGFVWIATRDGLNRYDGYDFKIYKNIQGDPKSLPSNIVQVLYMTRDSSLFIGTHGGLCIYDFKTGWFKSFSHDPADPTSLSNNAVYSIYEDRFGIIWVGTFGGGVCAFDRKTEEFAVYKKEENNSFSLSGNAIRAVNEDLEGNLWVGVDGDGLNKFDRIKKTFKRFRHDPNDPSSLGSDIVLCMMRDSEGYFWIGSWAGGVTKFDPLEGKAVRFFRNDPNDLNTIAGNEVFQIVEASTGDIWIGTRDGLDKFDPKTGKITHNQHDPLIEASLIFNTLCNLYEDSNGILWVCTEGGGLSVYDLYSKAFEHYKNDYQDENSLSNNNVVCFLENEEGNLYVGTDNGLNLINFRKNEVKRFFRDEKSSNTLPANKIRSLYQDSKKNIWIGTNGSGVARYNPDTKQYTTYTQYDKVEHPLSNNAIYGIIEDRKGYIWVSTYAGGLNRFDPKTEHFKEYTIDPDNFMQNVGWCLHIDSDGTLWCATIGHGVARYDESADKLVFYEKSEGNSISDNLVNDIYEAYGYLWFCMGGTGLDRFNKETGEFKNYNMSHGLPTGQTKAILADENGNLWVSTTNGLCRFNVEEEIFRAYDVLDGLQGNSFNTNTALISSKGEMFFGGKNGFTKFMPDSIKDNNVLPSVVLTDFKIFNKSVVPASDQPLKVQISEATELQIPYDKNNFSFEFAALHFSSPTKNKYKYMMEGYDENWFETDHSRRFAKYTNLPGGTYTFKVIASNNDGKWNEQGTSIKISIIPPYWQTIWFYVLCFLAVGGLIFSFIKYRENQAQKEKMRMQKEIDKAVDEVEKQKMEIIAQNKELQVKQKEEKERQWFNEGLALFSDILRENKNDIRALSKNILNNILRYIGAIQGGLFILNDEDENDKHLELIASYAYEKEMLDKRRIEIGEGMVGICYKEIKTKLIHDLPDNYMNISSSLGKTKAKQLVLIPLKLDELIFGVLEIASLNEITATHISLIEKLAENITSQLFTTKISMKTTQLLEQSQRQAEELKLQEEEARHKIEEIETINEEAVRLKSETLGYLESMNHSFIRADFDLQGNITYGNTKFLKYFGYSSEQVDKMHVTEFFPEETRLAFQKRWDGLFAGSKHIEDKFVHKAKNRLLTLISTFTVVRNLNGEMNNVLYLALDLTENQGKQDEILLHDTQLLNDTFIRALFDKGGNLVWANDKFLAMFGTKHKGGHQTINARDVLQFNEEAIFIEKWDPIFNGIKFEHEVHIEAAEDVWMKLMFIPNFESDGSVERVSFLATDISEYKLSEKKILDQFEKANKEIERLKTKKNNK